MIAHRLETAVSYCQKILVLEDGKQVEFDHPLRLLANSIEDEEITKKDGLFA
jgi:ABC-type multidrug transport system fused ATPase/permease subunit